MHVSVRDRVGVRGRGVHMLCVHIYTNQFIGNLVGWIVIYITSKEPVCPRVELILKIIIILLIIFLGFIKSKPC